MTFTLNPCPFCEGPPAQHMQDAEGKAPGPIPLQEDYGTDGVYAEAAVFCHECGAQGPGLNALIYDAADYQALATQAADIWNHRGNHNRELYDCSKGENA